ncbi:MAG: NUDIX hydrolase [Firmicutes bacterium]|nr:NUDIX hydrolase [Bacillota bacterium]
MDLAEKKLFRELVFDGSLLKVYRDQVELGNGRQATREWVNHPGAAAVIPLLDTGETLLVKQYRYALGRVTLEIPAGKIDPGETPSACAARELREETGLFGGELEPVGSFVTTPGFTNEEIHLFLSRHSSRGAAVPDQDELLNLVLLPCDEVFARIMDGRIKDAKTIIAFLLARTRGLL